MGLVTGGCGVRACAQSPSSPVTEQPGSGRGRGDALAATVLFVSGSNADHPPEYRVRPAGGGDVQFLTDVVVEATRAQGRWPEDFDEAEFRRRYVRWTEKHVRGEDPASTTSVVELAGKAVGRLRVVRDGQRIELAGIQLRPDAQGRGIGTGIQPAEQGVLGLAH
jgi:hypothetical protein